MARRSEGGKTHQNHPQIVMTLNQLPEPVGRGMVVRLAVNHLLKGHAHLDRLAGMVHQQDTHGRLPQVSVAVTPGVHLFVATGLLHATRETIVVVHLLLCGPGAGDRRHQVLDVGGLHLHRCNAGKDLDLLLREGPGGLLHAIVDNLLDGNPLLWPEDSTRHHHPHHHLPQMSNSSLSLLTQRNLAYHHLSAVKKTKGQLILARHQTAQIQTLKSNSSHSVGRAKVNDSQRVLVVLSCLLMIELVNLLLHGMASTTPLNDVFHLQILDVTALTADCRIQQLRLEE